MSRAVRLQLVGEKPHYPKIHDSSIYLLRHLSDIGYGQFKDGNFVPIDFQILESWKNLSGIEISYIEIKALMRLSSAYCDSLHKAKDKECEPPFML